MEGEILPETEYEFDQAEISGVIAGSVRIDRSNFVIGQTYTFIIDGEAYTTEPIEANGTLALGNPGLFPETGMDDNGLPFYAGFAEYGSGAPANILVVVMYGEPDTYHTIAINGQVMGIEKLDAKYLPDDAVKVTATAQVGQTLIVKAIDENGKPIEWECVDMPTWIPNFTESDEGAVLKIVNGTPTWVSET